MLYSVAKHCTKHLVKLWQQSNLTAATTKGRRRKRMKRCGMWDSDQQRRTNNITNDSNVLSVDVRHDGSVDIGVFNETKWKYKTMLVWGLTFSPKDTYLLHHDVSPMSVRHHNAGILPHDDLNYKDNKSLLELKKSSHNHLWLHYLPTECVRHNNDLRWNKYLRTSRL